MYHKHQLVLLILLFILLCVILYDYNIQNNKMNKRFYSLDETYSQLKEFIIDNNFKQIQYEVNNVMNNNLWQDWPEYNLWNLDINKSSKWTIFPFMALGKWSKNIYKCPTIYRLLNQVPNLVNASLSRFSPNTSLVPHQGWCKLSNYVLRCHLGIVIPGPAYIYCENEPRKQEVGKWIVFDDSKEHYADNQGLEDRIVLILDIKRPDNIEIGKSKIEDTLELEAFLKVYNDNI